MRWLRRAGDPGPSLTELVIDCYRPVHRGAPVIKPVDGESP